MFFLFEVSSGIFGVVPESVGVLIAGVGLAAAAFVLRRLISSGKGEEKLSDATESPNR